MDNDNINSTITELLKVIDEEKFNKLINVADVDKYVKKLTTYKFLQLMIVAQINELKSLSHITKS